MYKFAAGGLATGALLPAAGMSALSWLYLGMIVFVLVGAGFAVWRCVPKKEG